MSTAKSRFLHRDNTNGMIVSICCDCFETVTTAKSEWGLAAPEQTHVCNPLLLKKWKDMAQGMHCEEFQLAQRYGYSFALGVI
jgi:hypothetical protein